MYKVLTFSIFAILAASLLLSGCASEIAAPVDQDYPHGTVVKVPDPFIQTIDLDGSLSTVTNGYYVYTPPGYDPNRAEGYPTLYMLHGFGMREEYFVVLFSMTEIADWLLSRGEIEPMIMVFPSGRNLFYGSWFTNSPHPAVGNSETHILDIVAAVDAAYNTDPTQSKRAIGGQVQGGYGAISIAMNNPGIFGDVSAISAPLAFGGNVADTTTVIEALFGLVLQETGYGDSLAAWGGGDSIAYRNMIYPGLDRQVTSLVIAMSVAFSPTAMPGPTTFDSVIVGYDPNTGTIYKAMAWFDFPMDKDGNLHPPTWSRWLQYDLLTRLTTQATNLQGVNIYLDVGEVDDLYMKYAHEDFYQGLLDNGITTVTHNVFSSVTESDGTEMPANHSLHTLERLRLLMIWHSEHF